MSELNDVNKGPSEDAVANGVKVYCGTESEDIFYDDYLSSAMDAFVCGQYIARERKSFFFSILEPIHLNQTFNSFQFRWDDVLLLKYDDIYLFSSRLLSQDIVAQAKSSTKLSSGLKYSSRWAEMDEYKFLETEKILVGHPPQSIGKWKKESSDKIGILDGSYEIKCVEFLSRRRIHNNHYYV